MGIQETYSTENLVKKAIIDNGDGTTSINTNAKINVDTVNLTAEMKVDSGHDLYGAINVTKVADLQVSFDAIIGLKLAQIQSVENKTQGWVYNTKGATVTDTGITLVEANQNTGYPVIGASDEIEVIYRGTSRFDNKATEATLASLEGKDFATEATLSSLEGKDFATESTLDSIKDSITDGTQVSNVQGVYNATEPSLSDGEKVQLQVDSKGKLFVNSGASGVSGGGLSLYVLDSGNTLNQGKIEYTSASTCTLSALSFTASANLISKLDRIDNTGKLVATYTLADTAMTLSSNVLTVSGMTASATDTFVLYILGTERTTDISQNAVMTLGLKNVWNQYTDAEVLVTAQDLTDAYADFGAEIDMRGYTHLRVGIVLDVNDSENITMKLLGLNESGGTDEFEIEGGLTQAIAHTADGKYSYEFDVKGSPFVQIQAIAGTVGATAGDLTLTISKVWK